MAKLKKIIGIDVSKDYFDACIKKEKSDYQVKRYSNDNLGFEKLLTDVHGKFHFVMEATGPYYLRLAMFLHQKKHIVSIVNPLVIKRYSQMKLLRAKTDKVDAKLITEYGLTENENLIKWEPPKDYVIGLQQMQSLILQYQKQRNALNNQLKAFKETGILQSNLKKMIENELEHINLQMKLLEEQMKETIKKYHNEMLDKLISIPSIGNKTAILLIIITDGFKKFQNYKQLISYVGLSPRVYSSGTSVKGKAKICKMGMSRVRSMLYVCAWSAVKCNSSCKNLYDRLVEKGKPKKLALVAVANKLLKQSFAIATKNVYYNENI
jgi:transposase